MKKTLLFLAAVAFSFSSAIAQDVVYTSNTSQEIQPGSVACGANNVTSENHYYKKFNLADLGVEGTVSINNFDFGVESVIGGSINLNVELYKTTVNSFPATWGDGDGDDYTEIVSEVVTLTADDNLSIVSVSFDAVDVSEGEILVAHVWHPAFDFEGFYIGSNTLGDSQPSYLMAPECGINTPTPIGMVVDELNFIMNIASRTLGVADFTSADLTLYPNPASDQFNISSGNELIQTVIVRDMLGKTIETIQVNGLNQNVNVSNLPKGLYLVEVELETGRAVQKLIKN